jgi:SecD/SecF fusion protein
MEIESQVLRWSPLARLLRGSLIVALLSMATTFASPCLGQETTAEPAPATNAAAPAANGAAVPAADEASVTSANAVNVAIIVALFVGSIVIGAFLAKQLRMPDHGWKFAVAIGALAGAAILIARGEIKLGPDLSGGITLIYEVEDKQGVVQRTDAPPAQEEEEAAEEDQQLEEAGAAEIAADEGEDADAEDENAATREEQLANVSAMSQEDRLSLLIKALTERVDPSGTKEVTIRKFGPGQIEIIIPNAENKQELDAIERRIYTAGVLEFRITASKQFDQHRAIIEIAERLPLGQNIVRLDGKEVARWVDYDLKQFGQPDEARRFLVVREGSDPPQALVMTNDGLNVTGEFLRSAKPDVDTTGRPAVTFVFNSQGAFRFGQLTRAHQPLPSGAKYNLGILLDNRLLSAPNLNAVITDQGIIEGLDDEDEVNFLVGILNAGSLPASLNKEPISRAQISPTLGKITIENGTRALIVSLVVIALFMVAYYRFAGLVACIALASNMLLIVGAMVLIKGAFTLPGLAGLVLTVGMSVDANVLIYERIREELNRGAALRMAIRNGYARAMSAIIDSNVTTLITAVVIYKIAPDNVKGFGITLIIGLFTSLFTAIFLTRLVFDVAERLKMLKKLTMAQFVGVTNFDFLKYRAFWVTASLLLLAAGLIAVVGRGRDMLDIDFTGGSSVTIVLDEDHKKNFAEVMEVLQKSPLAEANLSLVEVDNSGTRYTVTTINDNVDDVERIIKESFGDSLQTYRVDVENVTPLSSPTQSSLDQFDGRLRGGLLGGLPISRTILQEEESALSDEAAGEPETAAENQGTAEEAPTQPSDSTASAETDADSTDQEASPPADASADEAAEADSTASETAEPPAETQEMDAATAEPTSAATDPFAGGTSAVMKFAVGDTEETGGVSHDVLAQLIEVSLEAKGHEEVAFELSNPEYKAGSIRNFTDWEVKIALPPDQAQQVFSDLQRKINSEPVFPLSNKIGGRVAGRMAADAIAATILSVAGIIAYVWFRFNHLAYALAAVVATVYDVLVTIAFLAFSAYIVGGAEPLASLLLIDKFQINLTLVAALLTIMGYSLNDTIVIFDRIREIKGKSPHINAEMINLAVNQTLSRTILTSLTTLMTVLILYVLGGEGIHAFAFAMLVGCISGVYSTIYIATPVLLWLSNWGQQSPAPVAKAA